MTISSLSLYSGPFTCQRSISLFPYKHLHWDLLVLFICILSSWNCQVLLRKTGENTFLFISLKAGFLTSLLICLFVCLVGCSFFPFLYVFLVCACDNCDKLLQLLLHSSLTIKPSLLKFKSLYRCVSHIIQWRGYF